jgi:Zn finger protein HypA/HybF involved in hydrogenase expression
MVTVTCKTCGKTEKRRVKDISQDRCSSCGGEVGFSVKCRKCGTVFARPKVENSGSLSAKELDRAQARKYQCPKCKSIEIIPNG